MSLQGSLLILSAYLRISAYGVATVSRIDKIMSLFCRILSLLEGSFAKETCNIIDPTNRSHPIVVIPGRYIIVVYLPRDNQCICPALLDSLCTEEDYV